MGLVLVLTIIASLSLCGTPGSPCLTTLPCLGTGNCAKETVHQAAAENTFAQRPCSARICSFSPPLSCDLLIGQEIPQGKVKSAAPPFTTYLKQISIFPLLFKGSEMLKCQPTPERTKKAKQK